MTPRIKITGCDLGALAVLMLTLLQVGCVSGWSGREAHDYSTIPFEAKLNNRIVQLPASGKFILESHLATTADVFPETGKTKTPRLFPKTTFTINTRPIGSDEAIQQHLVREWKEYRKFFPATPFKTLFDNTYVKQWTPAESGKPGQGSVGNTRPSVAEELWIANMYWSAKGKPKPGTKFLMTAHGKRVVVVMGYETGPEDPKFLGGAQGAVFKALGLKDNEVAEISCLKDQSVPVGPVISR
jgi:hypothetical protein